MEVEIPKKVKLVGMMESRWYVGTYGGRGSFFIRTSWRLRAEF